MSRTGEEWIAEANALLDGHRAMLAPLGVLVDPALAVRADTHPCPGYLHAELSIRFCPPVIDAPRDRLRWAFFAGYMGCASLDEAAAFYEDALPLIVAHELAHHLRTTADRSSPSAFLEEQICDVLAVALIDASPSRGSLPRLQVHCARMRRVLDARYAASAGAGFVADEAEVMVERGQMGAAELSDLEAASRKGDVSLETLVRLSRSHEPALLREAGEARERAREHLEAHYSTDPAAYWHLSLRWLEGYLARANRPPLVEVLNEHLAPARARSLDVVSSLHEMLLGATDPLLRRAAAMGLLEALGPDVAHDLADLADELSAPESVGALCRAVLHEVASGLAIAPAALVRLARTALTRAETAGDVLLAVLGLRVASHAQSDRAALVPLIERARRLATDDPHDPVAREARIASAAVRAEPVTEVSVRPVDVDGCLEALLAWSPPPGAFEASLESLVLDSSSPRARGLWLQLAARRAAVSDRTAALAASLLLGETVSSPRDHVEASVAVLATRGAEALLSALPRRGLLGWSIAGAALATSPPGAPMVLVSKSQQLRRAVISVERTGGAWHEDPTLRDLASSVLDDAATLCELATHLAPRTQPIAREGAFAARLEARDLCFEVASALSAVEHAPSLVRLFEAHRGRAPLSVPLAVAIAGAPLGPADDAAALTIRARLRGLLTEEDAAARDADVTLFARASEASRSRVLSLILRALGFGYADAEVLSLVERLVFLRTAPLFEEVGPDALLALAELSAEVRVPADAIVFREGEPGDVMYLLQKGSVRIWSGAAADERALGVLDPPACLGEVAVLDGGPRTASAAAITDCLLLAVEGAAIRRVGHREPALYEALLHVLAARLRAPRLGVRMSGRESTANAPRPPRS